MEAQGGASARQTAVGTEAAPLLLASLDEPEARAVDRALPARPKLRSHSRRLVTEILEERRVALVVLGHELGGPPVVRELRGAQLHAPLLYLAPNGRLDLEQAALEAGADAFLVRPVPPRRLGLYVQSLDKRRRPSGIVNRLRSGALQVDVTSRTATLLGRSVKLTRVRFDLLVHLLRHRDRVIPAAELVHTALAQPRGASNNARYHISYLRRDLGEYGTHIESVRGVGYRWAGPG